MSGPREERPLRLLALDGGGIRGLSELLILQTVMHRLMLKENEKRGKEGQTPLTTPPKPCDYFDLIGGTSTGGIIALMLGRLRMDVKTAIDHYGDLAKHVFSEPKLWGDGKFKATRLEEAIKSVVKGVTGDSESLLLEHGDAGGCRTFVCAMNSQNMSAGIPVVFRTYQSREVHSDCKIWEAARATSAAPTFFKSTVIGRGQRFVDGGLGRNNPSGVLLDEARGLFRDRTVACLLSIGTGQANIISIPKPGILQQIIPIGVINALKAIATDCEKTHEEMLPRFGNSPNTYFRLNVDQGLQDIRLSEWEKLGNVEAHTTQYMKRNEIDEKLDLLVDAIRVPRAQATVEQFIFPRPQIQSAHHIQERKYCPLPVKSFTGRKEILDKMHRYFTSDGNFQHRFVLYGLGGSGKSQLAFKFLQESQDNNSFSDIFYIDATNKETLEMDLMAITSGNSDQSVVAALRWLAGRHDGGWLLMFDNADDVHINLGLYLPVCMSGNILITTRNRELGLHGSKASVLKVSGMEHEDAVELLLCLSQDKETDENKDLAVQIVQELHHFALAITQAGAFIWCHSSLKKYKKLYSHERDKLLETKEVQGSDPYELAVYATWRLSYDKLDMSARSFLQICSVLHHEGIAEEMFEKAALSEWKLDDDELQGNVTQLLNQFGRYNSGWSHWVFLQVTGSLQSCSFIEYNQQNDTYSVHPLIQYWSHTIMELDIQVVQNWVLSIVGLSIYHKSSHDESRYRHTLLKHLATFRTLPNPNLIDPLVASHISLVYNEQHHWDKTEILQVIILENTKQIHGEDHLDTLRSRGNLAATYRNQGHWKKAEAVELVVMEKMKQILGQDHPDTLKTMANLAATYRSQGHWDKAEALQVVVVQKKKQILGEDHPDTLKSMEHLATTYWTQGHWVKAEELDVMVLEKRRQMLGEDHPDTLKTMGNLAATYGIKGHWKKAEALEVVVMGKRQQMLGEDHLDTLLIMGNLASTYNNQGQWDKAEALEVVVMEKRRQALGVGHPDTLRIMENLAATYKSQGHWDKAEALQVVVMEKRKQNLGETHPDTLLSMENLATTYGKQSNFNKAQALEVAMMQIREQILKNPI